MKKIRLTLPFTLMLTFGLVASAFAAKDDCTYDIQRKTLSTSASYSFIFSCSNSNGTLNKVTLDTNEATKKLVCSSLPVKKGDSSTYNLQLLSNAGTLQSTTKWRNINECNLGRWPLNIYDFAYQPNNITYMAHGSGQKMIIEPCNPKKFPLRCK